MTLLQLRPDDVRRNFGRTPFPFRHRLHEHPLTSLESLAQLADELPGDMVEHNVGRLPEVVPGGEVPKAAMTPGEMVRTIEANGCWMVLPIHSSPTYRELYDALFEEIRPLLGPREGAVRHRQAVFFLASSGSTTPAHIDLEQGFLMHIRGDKELRIGAFRDTEVAQREIEQFHTGGHRNVSELPPGMRTFALAPGDGVHVPAFTPHVVHTQGGGVALSLAFALRTEATLRDSAAHRANARLRRLGLRPSHPGARPRADRAKQGLVSVASVVAKSARRRSG